MKKALATEQRTVVVAADSAAAVRLDERLWQVGKFIPHGIGPDDHGDRQPVWLVGADKFVRGDETPPNDARIAIFYQWSDNGIDHKLEGLAKALFIVNCEDREMLAEAKRLWRKSGHKAEAFKKADGGWQSLEEPL